jgi:type II secretory pathway pseudopilin PulG
MSRLEEFEMSERDEDQDPIEDGEIEQTPSTPVVEHQETDWTDDSNMPFEDPEKKKKGGCLSPLGVFVIIGITGVLAAMLVPNFIRARSRGQLTACKSNLKNIGTAFEMYSTDYSGKYPKSMDLLTPKYLKTIPECPSAGKVTYTMKTTAAYNTAGFQDYYFIRCEGRNHTAVSVDENYPQYDGIQGLIERPPHNW